MAEPEHDPDNDECSSRRTVQVGELCAIDIKCVMLRWQHADEVHFTSRSFGDVTMQARWHGPFEEPS